LDTFASGVILERGIRGQVDQSKLELAGRRSIDVLDRMQEVFLPRDELLSSAGPVPVYYWLVRETPDSWHPFIRQFLLNFEEARKIRRESHIKGQVGEDDPVFSRYDTLNRSINDIGSHQGRFDILKKEFPEWLRNRQAATSNAVLKN
jgi:hypothetical protein